MHSHSGRSAQWVTDFADTSLYSSVTRVCWRYFNWNTALISLSHSSTGYDGEAASLETSVIEVA